MPRLPPRPPARQASCLAGRRRRSPRASYAGSEKVLVDLQGLLERPGADGVTVRKSHLESLCGRPAFWAVLLFVNERVL